MLTYVLGAPGSGKSSLVPLLRDLLRDHVILDWDAFVPAASELAGRDVRQSPATWPSYRTLMRAVVEAIAPAPRVVLGVCTPDELEGWAIDAWVLLDCTDEERRRRLSRQDAAEIVEAMQDAAQYRSLGMPVVDTTARSPLAIAGDLAHLVREVERSR